MEPNRSNPGPSPDSDEPQYQDIDVGHALDNKKRDPQAELLTGSPVFGKEVRHTYLPIHVSLNTEVHHLIRSLLDT